MMRQPPTAVPAAMVNAQTTLIQCVHLELRRAQEAQPGRQMLKRVGLGRGREQASAR